jgi:hypothetical protein
MTKRLALISAAQLAVIYTGKLRNALNITPYRVRQAVVLAAVVRVPFIRTAVIKPFGVAESSGSSNQSQISRQGFEIA